MIMMVVIVLLLLFSPCFAMLHAVCPGIDVEGRYANLGKVKVVRPVITARPGVFVAGNGFIVLLRKVLYVIFQVVLPLAGYRKIFCFTEIAQGIHVKVG